MNTDKEREMGLKTATIVRARIRQWGIIVDTPCDVISISFDFSLSVFIRVHPWFQKVSPCA
jgi:hypothetical protein